MRKCPRCGTEFEGKKCPMCDLRYRGGVWKVRQHGRFVRWEPIDETIEREGAAIKRQQELGLLSGRSIVDGGKGKKCGSSSRRETAITRTVTNLAWRKYMKVKKKPR